MKRTTILINLIAILALLLTACEFPLEEQEQPTATAEAPPADPPAPTATFTPTPQPFGETGDYGPQDGNFPPGVSPLTGLPALDPSLLDLPAIMVSIPLFPASGRPLAGISSAPWIFEIYIGEGMTRLLAVFYGEEPRFRPNPTGSCEVNAGPFPGGEAVLGNRAWLDEDADGVQDPGEAGLGGICVTLYDLEGNALQATSTDSNGYYGFETAAGQEYRIGFEKPPGLDFTTPEVGLDDLDSDADPASGLTAPLHFAGTDLTRDAGYVLVEGGGDENGDPPNGSLPAGGFSPSEAGVGPIRSMRLPYGRIGGFFQGGCIVSASGDPSVLAQVPGCRYVYGDDADDINSAFLDITDLRSLAEANKNPNYPLNYSGNLFSLTPPAGGQPADQVDVFWNWQNQSQYVYDPLAGAYRRFANLPGDELTFTPQTDRLTGRQLLYENVLFMFVEHTAYAETLIDIKLSIGNMGHAILFRDGQVYRLYWNTIAQEYEQQTQRLRPIRFTDADGNPVALKPGHFWVHVFTPASYVSEKDPGYWKARFLAP